MTKVRVSELSGIELDYAVATCEGVYLTNFISMWYNTDRYKYSSDWAHGGPIIERERLYMTRFGDDWQVRSYWHNGYRSFVHVFMYEATDSSPLVAAMRCYVASKLGEVVDIPEHLNG